MWYHPAAPVKVKVARVLAIELAIRDDIEELHIGEEDHFCGPLQSGTQRSNNRIELLGDIGILGRFRLWARGPKKK